MITSGVASAIKPALHCGSACAVMVPQAQLSSVWLVSQEALPSYYQELGALPTVPIAAGSCARRLGGRQSSFARAHSSLRRV